LHTLYKGKHEAKVAALKKSYEARWEKRVREAESKLKDAMEEIERLKTERDATMSGVIRDVKLGPSSGDTTILRECEELEAHKKVLEARVKGLEEEIKSVKRDSENLRSELKSERAEKGELVAVVDEWLAMQQEQQHHQQSVLEPRTSQESQNPSDSSSSRPNQVNKPAVSASDTAASNIGRAVPATSGIRPRAIGGPTPKVARFGMPGSAIPGGHARGNSGSGRTGCSGPGGIPAPGRSGIMSSIERMGRGGG
jgi:hypothetical protein